MPHDLILFLAANPSNTTRLALDEECAAIERELRMAANRDFEFQSRWAVTVDELMHHLNVLQPTVIHFSGHGTRVGGVPNGSSVAFRDIDITDRNDGSGIYLEDERRGPQLVTADALAKMISSATSSVRLVVLNACYSEAQAEVVRSVVDCVVGMAGAISDDAARVFAVSFYRALGHRRSVANAIEQAVATLAGKQFPREHLPSCRTRDGIDASKVVLGGSSVRGQPWVRKAEAVCRLANEAHEKLKSDPFSTAARAQQVIEHIVDYLCESEIGTADHHTLDEKLKRIEAKFVIPPTVASHFHSVLLHTRPVIHAAGADPDPSLLQPCLGSLAVVVEWFFREYGKQHATQLECTSSLREQSESTLVQNVTPKNARGGVNLSTGSTGAAELLTGDPRSMLMPVWRLRRVASVLRIEVADSDASDACVFKIESSEITYFIGRTNQRSDGTRNDCAFPKTWTSISRDQATLMMQERGVLLTNTSSKNNIFVREEVVAKGGSRLLRHGDTVQLGRCIGVFSDGRYYPATPAAMIDRRTGLLSRRGIVTEIAGALATNIPRTLFIVRCPEDTTNVTNGVVGDPKRKAVMVAVALHRYDPSSPIARIRRDVAVMLASVDAVHAMATIADQVCGARCVSGFVTLRGTAGQALLRLEACRGALSRFAIAGREPVGPEDLTGYEIVPTRLDAFPNHVRPLFKDGGGAILFVLSDLERLQRMAPQAVPVLELELAEMLGARMGPKDVISFAGRGLVLFGVSGDAERLAREVSVAWHAWGPVTVDTFEFDRCLSAHLLALSDLDDLAGQAAALARGENSALGATGLPAPLALGVVAIDQAQDPIERARALICLIERSWKLLTFILIASARHAHVKGTWSIAELEGGLWPAPWRSLAQAVAQKLEGLPMRVMELASAAASSNYNGTFRSAMDTITAVAELLNCSITDRHLVQQSLPRLEKAVREILTALVPLRGWTLVAVISSEIVDVDGIAQRVEYIDYTGPNARGSHHSVTVMGYRGLGRFCYLVRWNEGLAITLEPFVRCINNNISGVPELFLANTAVSEPGLHRYCSITSTHEMERVVTAKQLGTLATKREDQR